MEKNITDKTITNIEKTEIGKEPVLSVEKPVEIPSTPLSPRPKFEVPKPTGGGGGDGGNGPIIRIPHPSEFRERTVQQRIPSRPELDVPAGFCGTRIKEIDILRILGDNSIVCEFTGDYPDWLHLTEGKIHGTRPDKPHRATTATFNVKYGNKETVSCRINVGAVIRKPAHRDR